MARSAAITLMRVTRIKLWLLGERDYPEGVVTLSGHIVGDIDDLFTRARDKNPGVSLHSMVEAIWTMGVRRLDDNLRHGLPVRAGLGSRELPRFRVPEESSQ